MTLQDFEKDIDLKILERGYDYYKSDCVEELEELKPGLWVADVIGTEIYTVSIELRKEQITDWECDCPYDYGPICKHVVAVFYAVAEKGNNGKEKGNKKSESKNKKIHVEKIFQRTTKEDLQAFLINKFSKYRGLKNSFIAHFAEYIEDGSHHKYRLIVRNLYKAAEGRHGFIDYRSANQLMYSLLELVDTAVNLLAERNVHESLLICKILIEEAISYSQNMDDSGGGLGTLLYSTFDVVSEIIEIAPPELKDELFEYFISEYPKQGYHDVGISENILEFIPDLISLSNQEIKFFNLIEEQIKCEQKNSSYQYGVVRLLKTKIDYLLQRGRDDEAWELIEDNKEYSKFREMIVDKNIKKKEYETAIKMCFEGIKATEKVHHHGVTHQWEDKLLSIYLKQKDIKNVRASAEKLFIKGFSNFKYYRILKSTYESDEWKNVCEKIINKIKGESQQGYSWDASRLADIFIEEHYLERLLKLLEINSERIELIDKYAKYLKDEYPSKIVLLYKSGIISYGRHTGRKYYKDIVTYLKRMKRIDGSKEKIKEIIDYLFDKYKSRSAMKEILNENFPGVSSINTKKGTIKK